MMSYKKRWTKALAGVLLAVLVISMPAGDFSGVGAESVEAASVKINKKKVTLNQGKIKTLSIKKGKKKVKASKWTSSNKKVATVTSSGKVKAVAGGTARITAVYKGKKYTCKVTVRGLSRGSMKLEENFAPRLTLKNLSKAQKKKTIRWTSSNKKVVSLRKVSKTNYYVEANNAGTAIVTAQVGKTKYTCKVTVTGDSADTSSKSKEKTYKITYVLDGGTNDPSNPTSYTASSGDIKLKDPTKEGYLFSGWTLNSPDEFDSTTHNGNGVDTIFSAAWAKWKNGDITLYAHWDEYAYTGNSSLRPQDRHIYNISGITGITDTDENYKALLSALMRARKPKSDNEGLREGNYGNWDGVIVNKGLDFSSCSHDWICIEDGNSRGEQCAVCGLNTDVWGAYMNKKYNLSENTIGWQMGHAGAYTVDSEVDKISQYEPELEESIELRTSIADHKVTVRDQICGYNYVSSCYMKYRCAKCGIIVCLSTSSAKIKI